MESEQNVESPKVTPNIPDNKKWESITPGYYYNKTNLTKSSNIISVWTYKIVTDDNRKEKIEMEKKYGLEKSIKYQNYEYQMMLWKINCRNRQSKTEKIIEYDKTVKVLDQYTYKNNEWDSIPPESIFEGLYNKVCLTPNKPSEKK